MTTTQRVTHSVLFEVFALIIVVPLVIIITGKGTGELLFVAIGLSFYAVIWNYFYNIWFDHKFGKNRSERSFLVRLVHAVGFEGGIILVTLPVISWFMGISLFSAFLLELAFLVLFFFYALVFNYVYDLICEHMQVTST